MSGRCVLPWDAVAIEEGRERQHVNDLRPRPGCLLFLSVLLLLASTAEFCTPFPSPFVFSAYIPSCLDWFSLVHSPPSSSPPLMSCKFSIRNRAPGISNEMLVFSVSSGRKSRNAWNQWKDQIIMRGNYFCKSINLNNTQAKLKLQVFKGYFLYYKWDSKNFYFIFHDQNPRVKNFNLGKIVRII